MHVAVEIPGGASPKDLEHLQSVFGGHFATAQPCDEVDHDWPSGAVVERRPKLGEQHAAIVRRAEAVVAVDDAEALEPAQPLNGLVGGEGTEPLEPREADLVSLLTQAAHYDATGHRNGALADEHVVGIVGHVLLDE